MEPSSAYPPLPSALTRRQLGLALLLAGALQACGTPGPRRPARVGLDVFVTALAPYGTWVVVAEFGNVWVPSNMPPGWRPYTRGRWVTTAEGWTWVSAFDWGWAPFHYGRWTFVDGYGWAWIPGVTWAPAWVTWRLGPEWIGWAPLPPSAVASVSGTWTVGEASLGIALSAWCFVPRIQFWSYPLLPYFAPLQERERLVERTRHETTFVLRDGRARQVVPEAWTPVDPGHPKPPVYDLRDVDAVGSAHRSSELTVPSAPRTEPATGAPGELRIFRPPVERSSAGGGTSRTKPRPKGASGRPGRNG